MYVLFGSPKILIWLRPTIKYYNGYAEKKDNQHRDNKNMGFPAEFAAKIKGCGMWGLRSWGSGK